VRFSLNISARLASLVHSIFTRVPQSELPFFPSLHLDSSPIPRYHHVHRRHQRRARSDGPVMVGNLNIPSEKRIIIRGEVDSYIIFQYRTRGGRDATSFSTEYLVPPYIRSLARRPPPSPASSSSSSSFRCRLILMALSEIH